MVRGYGPYHQLNTFLTNQLNSTNVEQQTTATSGYKLDNAAVVLLTCVFSGILQDRKQKAVQHIKRCKAMLALHELGSDDKDASYLVIKNGEPSSMDDVAADIRESLASAEQAKADLEAGKGSCGVIQGILDELRPNYELIKSNEDHFNELVKEAQLDPESIV